MSAPAAVRERPILFSGPMVRAILDGSKTQTRRALAFPRAVREIEGGVHLVEFDRLQPGYADGSTRVVFGFDGEPNSFAVRCPHGEPGDRLWVRETFVDARCERPERDLGILYAADCPPGTPAGVKGGWKPSIFMPRDASRLTLEITGVRVERVQAIDSSDVLAEGVADPDATILAGARVHNPERLRAGYRELWDSLNASRGYGWDANPWVWVVEFARVAA